MTLITMYITRACNRIIEYSFYALFFLVALVIARDTSELFEFNKMWLTFGLTIIICAAWFTKMIIQRQIFIQRTPLDIPIALFLISQVISTIFSWDTHISIWGYYSRFNGGSLSIVTYIFLYYAFLSNFRNEQARGDASGGVQRSTSSFAVPRSGTRLEGAPLDERAAGPRAIGAVAMVKRLIFVSLLSGLLVALWGLPSHFGYDPTCLLFRGTLDVSCWTEDFQPKIRIFSTLGQPDWLAAYLAILLPISIIMFIKSIKNLPLSIFYLLVSAVFYLDLLYTRARSGILAVWLSLAFFVVLYILLVKREFLKLSILLIVFLSITFFIGTPFSVINRFTLEGMKAQPSGAGSKTPRYVEELGGTDSATIRRIVWKGAINAWLDQPIFGTGVETFAFAYYRHKDAAQNLTSEWNFLYNKAHNEFLNYLATTGIFGLGTYILMIGWFFWTSFTKNANQFTNFAKKFASFRNKNEPMPRQNMLLILALVSSYISILVTNFFGFSVVITNIYLFMIPSFIFILGGMINPQKQFVFPQKKIVNPLLEKQPITISQWTFIVILLFVICYLIFTLFKFWNADKNYSLGYNLNRAGEYLSANPYLRKAVQQRGEPVFKDELAVSDVMLAVELLGKKNSDENKEALEKANNLAREAIEINDQLTANHEYNVVFWKTRTRIFYNLSQIDSQYLPLSLNAIQKAASLSPNDAGISYNLGVLYGQNNDIKNGIDTLENTIRLKPDYRDAYYALGLFYHDQAVDEKGNVVDKEKLDKAIDQMQYILDHLSPNDAPAQEALQGWRKK